MTRDSGEDMRRLNCELATVDDIAGMDISDRPFLHEQGQVVLRGFVQSLEITGSDWHLHVRDVESLQKYAGIWTADEPLQTYGGPLAQTTFRICREELHPEREASLQVSCYGSLFHVAARLREPWVDNLWPALDTDFLPPDMPTENTS